jgi:histidinol dehydrogenase
MIKIYKYGEVSYDEIFARDNIASNVEDIVTDIIKNVRSRGDKALFEYSAKFDKAELSSLEVSSEEIEEAFASVDAQFISIIEEAAENIRAFHKRQVRNSFVISEKDGVVTGQKVMPIEKVGLYVPGGTAAYPSTVLMDSVPAKIAGCGEIVMVTPPNKEGKVNPGTLAAAKVAGVDEIYKVGGAQAIAALAYGTESIPKVDKITGPGNIFVALEKKSVYGHVSIDSIDVGIPQLAMHSANEVVGSDDTFYLYKVFKKFYDVSIKYEGDSIGLLSRK